MAILVVSTYATFSNMKAVNEVEEINYVSNNIWSNDTPVVASEAAGKLVIKPFSSKDVTVGRYFYDYKEDSTEQQNAIIFYENSYIQNSGVDYILDKEFDVVSVYDGIVTKIEDNDLAGKTIEIKHDENVISVYQSLGSVSVKQGDTVKQGDIVGKSGNSKINKDLGNHLHFELYVKGQVVNPEECYNKKITDLK